MHTLVKELILKHEWFIQTQNQRKYTLIIILNEAQFRVSHAEIIGNAKG